MRGTKSSLSERLADIFSGGGHLMVSGVPEGLDTLVLGEFARQLRADDAAPGWAVLHVARDDKRMAAIAGALKFFAPDIKVISFPAWDCVPYDRISPHADISSRRMASLAHMIASKNWKHPVIVLTTTNAVVQRVPPREYLQNSVVRLKAGSFAGFRAADILWSLVYLRGLMCWFWGSLLASCVLAMLRPDGLSYTLRAMTNAWRQLPVP